MRDTFRGSYTALPTPFRNGELDLNALNNLVELQLAGGTRGVVATGTSGEASSLSGNEFERVVETVIEATRGRMQVLVGVGTNSTKTTIARAKFAERVGADGLLVVTPYYNRPSPAGLIAHYSALAESVSTPIVLYNVPSRTGVDLTVEIVAELADAHPSIVGIKQASRSIARIRDLAQLDTVGVLGGEDGLLLEFMQAGAIGAIGVVSNLVPERTTRLIQLAGGSTESHSDSETAEQLTRELAPLIEALFVESNPIPLKAALAGMGLCDEELRLPLTPLQPQNREKLKAALSGLGLLDVSQVVRHPV